VVGLGSPTPHSEDGSSPGTTPRIRVPHRRIFHDPGTNARALNPITTTNWEGVGVIPDVKVPADEALDAALRLARERR
jgi:hypothetical protein